MERINSLSFLLATLTLASCASVPSQGKLITIQQIEQFPIGSPSEETLKSLGEPRESREVNGETVWVYDSPNGEMQRASIVFDKDKRLQSKLIIPNESEPEAKVEFLSKSKFPQSKFRTVTFPQCGMDYVSGSALYADVATGASIRYRREQKDVEAIAWTTPVQLRQEIVDIEKCDGRIRAKR